MTCKDSGEETPYPAFEGAERAKKSSAVRGDVGAVHSACTGVVELINAPRKKMYIMEDMTHGLLESRSEEFSEILHEIAQLEHQNR